MSRLTSLVASCLIGLGPVSLHAAAGQAGSDVVPVTVMRPAYPRIAESARVHGEVEVQVAVRPNGTVESATVIRGLPLLQPAALEAARKSRFDCRRCSDPVTPYLLMFAFLLEDGNNPATSPGAAEAVRLSPTQSRVTVVAKSQIVILDNIAHVSVRSIRCLYLWYCGSR